VRPGRAPRSALDHFKEAAMRTTLTRGLGALAATMGALLANPAAAQLSTTANGPYYSMPAWSQKLTTNRFVILANWNNEAVLDRETGLVWERAPTAFAFSYLQIHLICNDRATGGRKGWRVPSVQELASLVDPTVASPGPALPAGHPFVDVQPVFYWSASTRGLFPDNSFAVSFETGHASTRPEGNPGLVWCVRGGPSADAQ
jgi:hypothetical protein